jgi:phosphoribosylaminoimidazolecarboxamide formyltransferase / IMP cyclohydrolase
MIKKITSALISVWNKQGLDDIALELNRNGVLIYSTGGTADHLEALGIKVIAVEELTGYPSILGGRVKTLHPKVFGGILARRQAEDLSQLEQYEIPPIDLVIVDLYPFEDTVRNTSNESEIIEKIDIGGISLIRAAAKNHQDVCVIADKSLYENFYNHLKINGISTDLAYRKQMAAFAFDISSHYDTAIFNYFNQSGLNTSTKLSIRESMPLRYGENPHQTAHFAGELNDIFDFLNGKTLSFNNLTDVDAAVHLMKDFLDEGPTFAILKHNNSCGLASRDNLSEAWDAALAGDPVSAFGGVLVCNTIVDLQTALKIDLLFYEVLIAPDFEDEAIQLLSKKKNRILLLIKSWEFPSSSIKSLLNGYIVQDKDAFTPSKKDLNLVTDVEASEAEIQDLLYASKCVKHLKSNAIAIVKNRQLIGMGCGQTSRVDALRHAIHKATSFNFSLEGAVMASEAFFPFPDCVEIAYNAGIKAVIQPGGSIKDQDSIDFCNQHAMSMYCAGHRHFKH